jgi:hypothetical protein
MINFINEINHENPKDFCFSTRNRSEITYIEISERFIHL